MAERRRAAYTKCAYAIEKWYEAIEFKINRVLKDYEDDESHELLRVENVLRITTQQLRHSQGSKNST